MAAVVIQSHDPGLTCHICQQEYTVVGEGCPRILSCDHSFCEYCISVVPRDTPSTILCPWESCCQPTDLSHGAAALPLAIIPSKRHEYAAHGIVLDRPSDNRRSPHVGASRSLEPPAPTQAKPGGPTQAKPDAPQRPAPAAAGVNNQTGTPQVDMKEQKPSNMTSRRPSRPGVPPPPTHFQRPSSPNGQTPTSSTEAVAVPPMPSSPSILKSSRPQNGQTETKPRTSTPSPSEKEELPTANPASKEEKVAQESQRKLIEEQTAVKKTLDAKEAKLNEELMVHTTINGDAPAMFHAKVTALDQEKERAQKIAKAKAEELEKSVRNIPNPNKAYAGGGKKLLNTKDATERKEAKKRPALSALQSEHFDVHCGVVYIQLFSAQLVQVENASLFQETQRHPRLRHSPLAPPPALSNHSKLKSMFGRIRTRLIVQLGSQDLDSSKSSGVFPQWKGEMFKLRVTNWRTETICFRLCVRSGLNEEREVGYHWIALSDIISEEKVQNKVKVHESMQIQMSPAVNARIKSKLAFSIEFTSRPAHWQMQPIRIKTGTTADVPYAALIERGLSFQEVEEIRASYEVCANTENGEVFAVAIETLMYLLGLDPTFHFIVEEMCEALGVDTKRPEWRRESIAWDDFLVALAGISKNKILIKPKPRCKFLRITFGRALMIRRVFEEIDLDGSNMVDFGELKDALEKMDGKQIAEKLNTAFREMDVDGDGFVQFSEFLRAMVNNSMKLTSSRAIMKLQDNLRGTEELPSFMKRPEEDDEAIPVNPFAERPKTIFEKVGTKYILSPSAQKEYKIFRERTLAQLMVETRPVGVLNKVDRKILRQVERQNLGLSALGGLVSGTIIGLMEKVAFDLYESDGFVETETGTGSVALFWLLLMTVTIIVTFFEIIFIYFVSLRHCVRLSAMAGMTLWPVRKERAFIIDALVQSALEIPMPSYGSLGLTYLHRGRSTKMNTIAALVVYKGKAGVSSLIIRILLTRVLIGRAARVVLPAIAALVNIFWNCWNVLKNNREARARCFGPSSAIACIDTILDGRTFSPKCRLQLLRAIGTIIVLRRRIHPCLFILFTHAKRRLGFVGVAPLDNPAMFIGELPLLKPHEQVLVSRVMVLASVMDGGLSRKEWRYVNRCIGACGLQLHKNHVRLLADLFLDGEQLFRKELCNLWSEIGQWTEEAFGTAPKRPKMRIRRLELRYKLKRWRQDIFEARAAVAIQTTYRGFLTRKKERDQLAKQAAARRIQTQFRGYRARNKYELERSALKIQKVFRGRRARTMVAQMLLAQQELPEFHEVVLKEKMQLSAHRTIRISVTVEDLYYDAKRLGIPKSRWRDFVRLHLSQ